MDIETIITIIIIAASLIIGAIGKSRGKPGAPRQRPVFNPGEIKDRIPGSSLGDLIREINNQAFNIETETEEDIEIKKDTKSKPTFEEVLDAPVSELDKPSKEEGISSTGNIIFDYDENKTEISASWDEFDIRKAIIYSEIINRKY